MTTPGLIAGRFDVEACVSEGGMGRLFRARDRASGDLVAVKLRQPSASARRFAREASVLAQLGEHPHVVRYVADGEDAVHGAYLAMEWLEGEDLSHRLSRGPLSFAEAWRIGREASAALAHAHAHGFVHRDLKPSNLFLCRESGASRVKLLDFGIVRQREGTPLSQAGATIGSPPYMAPEQVRGERECTPAADVFALGCVLWECVVGRSPFHASHPAGMLAKILYDPSPSLRSELPSAPLALHTLLARMMEKRVDERIADGGQLHAAFARPLPSDLEALEAESSPAPFAARERSPISLLVVVSGLVADDLTPCFGELTPGMLEPALRATAAAHGGRLDQLPDGSALVFFDAELPAVEQARAAAACALAARELCRPRPLCLLSGRTAPDDPSPISRTVERAAGLLRHGTADCIYVDDLSATLIDAAFECTGVGEGRTLSTLTPLPACRAYRLSARDTEPRPHDRPALSTTISPDFLRPFALASEHPRR
jgi:eukaryotic-like serine/threonine-protein kinase